MRKDRNIQIWVEPDVKAALAAAAEQSGMTLSAFMMMATMKHVPDVVRTAPMSAAAQPPVSRAEAAAILPGQTEEALLELGRLCTLANENPRDLAREVFADAGSTMSLVGASVPQLIGQDVWDQFAEACQKCGADPARTAATILHMINRGLSRRVAAREGMQR